jgi:hypothetical protein
MKSKSVVALTLAAITAVISTAAETSTQSVQLRFFSLGKSIVEAGIAGTDDRATPVFIPADTLSRPVKHLTGRLRLISTQADTGARKKPDEPLKPEDIPPSITGFRKMKSDDSSAKVKAGNRELGWIDLPFGYNQRFIIIVHPGKGNGLTAIRDQIGTFPSGSDRYINLTNTTVIIEIPAGRHSLPVNGSIVLRPGVTHLSQFHLKITTKTDGEEQVIFSAFNAQDDGRRNLRILTPGITEGDSIQLKSISDRLADGDNYR